MKTPLDTDCVVMWLLMLFLVCALGGLACYGDEPSPAACPICGGSGRMIEYSEGEAAKEVDCFECKGSGLRPEYEWETRVTCNQCQGSGKNGEDICPKCDGLGWTPDYSKLLDGHRLEKLRQAAESRREEIRKRHPLLRSLWRLGDFFDGIVALVNLPSKACLVVFAVIAGVFVLMALRIVFHRRPAK